jgi:hypothetical protein
VCHKGCGLAIYIKKYGKAKEELDYVFRFRFYLFSRVSFVKSKNERKKGYIILLPMFSSKFEIGTKAHQKCCSM